MASKMKEYHQHRQKKKVHEATRISYLISSDSKTHYQINSISISLMILLFLFHVIKGWIGC